MCVTGAFLCQNTVLSQLLIFACIFSLHPPFLKQKSAIFTSSFFANPAKWQKSHMHLHSFLTKLPSAINPVTTLSVDYSCSSSMVTVTWGLVFGANLYRASAVDGTGASLNCTSATGSCHITMLKCGEKYEVHVTAISDDCESRSNTSALFETGGCGSLCSCFCKYMHVCMAT